MASDGSRGPRPFLQTTVSTCFIRVPWADWPLVRKGAKTEFRGSPGKSSGLWHVVTPTPCVAYAIGTRGHESALMVLEEARSEPLGAITAESLAREGFETFEQFRNYWMRRERKRFRPSRNVLVHVVRPWDPFDEQAFGSTILHRLYGAWLGDNEAIEARTR